MRPSQHLLHRQQHTRAEHRLERFFDCLLRVKPHDRIPYSGATRQHLQSGKVLLGRRQQQRIHRPVARQLTHAPPAPRAAPNTALSQVVAPIG